MNQSILIVHVFEHAFEFRLAYASWKARCKRAMKRKYRDNSIDTSPTSTSSESSTILVSCSYENDDLFLIHQTRSVEIIVVTRKKNEASMPFEHVSIFLFIAALNSVVESLQLLSLK